MNILVIRRDNIGDLVCTTPLLAAIRKAMPAAWIGVLANQYNAPILDGNPDIDAVFAYRKAKHRAVGESRLANWYKTATLLWQLRCMRLDIVLCASPRAYRFARLLGARRIIEADRTGEIHEVEITFRLMSALGIASTPGPLILHSDDTHRTRMCVALGIPEKGAHCVALHISARKLRQRWSEANFAELARRLLQDGNTDRILLFWAPGSEDDPQHPGDDSKAARLLDDLIGLPVTLVPTHTLEELVAGLSLADAVICSDGGAMHIAAGLGKPIVCFFGNSSAERWHPWHVPHELLQKPSRDVADITTGEALAAFERLMERVRSPL
jgi:ADP-heptose:LPS heptosyltransferase